MRTQTCSHCGEIFEPNPRVKNQRYCPRKDCQKARRAVWYRNKMSVDADYRDNQRRCQKQWQIEHPDYWRDYRARHPDYVVRNNLLQIRRNLKWRKDKVGKLIAKIDALDRPRISRKGQLFRLIPQQESVIAKIDALIVKLIPIKELGVYNRVYTVNIR